MRAALPVLSAMKIQLSAAFKECLDEIGHYDTERRGVVKFQVIL